MATRLTEIHIIDKNEENMLKIVDISRRSILNVRSFFYRGLNDNNAMFKPHVKLTINEAYKHLGDIGVPHAIYYDKLEGEFFEFTFGRDDFEIYYYAGGIIEVYNKGIRLSIFTVLDEDVELSMKTIPVSEDTRGPYEGVIPATRPMLREKLLNLNQTEGEFLCTDLSNPRVIKKQDERACLHKYIILQNKVLENRTVVDVNKFERPFIEYITSVNSFVITQHAYEVVSVYNPYSNLVYVGQCKTDNFKDTELEEVEDKNLMVEYRVANAMFNNNRKVSEVANDIMSYITKPAQLELLNKYRTVKMLRTVLSTDKAINEFVADDYRRDFIKKLAYNAALEKTAIMGINGIDNVFFTEIITGNYSLSVANEGYIKLINNRTKAIYILITDRTYNQKHYEYLTKDFTLAPNYDWLDRKKRTIH
ncbi:MAG: hypothetical protein ATN34_05445 [Epulopiscium sp. Nele67-Bin002]|nr:MAG: hypothetical protein ATN34_05445 [Epulopiscium sp. Nele67-Bin002]